MAGWLPRGDYLLAQEQARRFTIVSVDEARKLTGLEPEQLAVFGAERLTREYADGRREQAIRLPREFVPETSYSLDRSLSVRRPHHEPRAR